MSRSRITNDEFKNCSSWTEKKKKIIKKKKIHSKGQQHFKGSGNGKSDKTIEAYLTGAAWYLSSAMVILRQQHGNDSRLYTAAKEEHGIAQGIHIQHVAG